MIDQQTGEVSFDGGIVARPHMPEAAFLATSLGQASARRSYRNGHSRYSLPRPQMIDGREWSVSFGFTGGQLTSISLALSDKPGATWADWSEAKELLSKDQHDQILRNLLGPPPYRFAWGEVSSTYDPRGGAASITISYPIPPGVPAQGN